MGEKRCVARYCWKGGAVREVDIVFVGLVCDH